MQNSKKLGSWHVSLALPGIDLICQPALAMAPARSGK
jgi:hypothetical protein